MKFAPFLFEDLCLSLSWKYRLSQNVYHTLSSIQDQYLVQISRRSDKATVLEPIVKVKCGPQKTVSKHQFDLNTVEDDPPLIYYYLFVYFFIIFSVYAKALNHNFSAVLTKRKFPLRVVS